jgi:hypothetical protein
MKPRKSWREKLADDKDLPKVGEVTGKLTKRWGEGHFVIPAPREVDALMKQVPKDRVVTINELPPRSPGNTRRILLVPSRREFFRGSPRTLRPRTRRRARNVSRLTGGRSNWAAR